MSLAEPAQSSVVVVQNWFEEFRPARWSSRTAELKFGPTTP